MTDQVEFGSSEIHHAHRDVTGGWLRPTVFGMMDGLVSNFALIIGFAGGHAGRRTIVLAGLAGLVAGACSMATGEYVSVQSQNESTRAELAVEKHELEHNAAAELQELAESYVARGVDPDLAHQVAEQLSRDPEQALLIHAQEELGIDPNQLPSPRTAAVSSLLSFSFGAFLPLLPYLLGANTVLISGIVAVIALFVAGALTARFTVRSWLYSGSRQLMLGALACARHLRRRACSFTCRCRDARRGDTTGRPRGATGRRWRLQPRWRRSVDGPGRTWRVAEFEAARRRPRWVWWSARIAAVDLGRVPGCDWLPAGTSRRCTGSSTVAGRLTPPGSGAVCTAWPPRRFRSSANSTSSPRTATTAAMLRTHCALRRAPARRVDRRWLGTRRVPYSALGRAGVDCGDGPACPDHRSTASGRRSC